MENINELVEAIRAGNESRVHDLLAADPQLAGQRDPSGVSLLMLACYYRQPGIANLLRSALTSLDVFEAAALGDVKQLQAAVDADPAQVRAWSPDGFQP